VPDSGGGEAVRGEAVRGEAVRVDDHRSEMAISPRSAGNVPAGLQRRRTHRVSGLGDVHPRRYVLPGPQQGADGRFRWPRTPDPGQFGPRAPTGKHVSAVHSSESVCGARSRPICRLGSSPGWSAASHPWFLGLRTRAVDPQHPEHARFQNPLYPAGHYEPVRPGRDSTSAPGSLGPGFFRQTSLSRLPLRPPSDDASR
jgi:hypothetical protein